MSAPLIREVIRDTDVISLISTYIVYGEELARQHENYRLAVVRDERDEFVLRGSASMKHQNAVLSGTYYLAVIITVLTDELESVVQSRDFLRSFPQEKRAEELANKICRLHTEVENGDFSNIAWLPTERAKVESPQDRKSEAASGSACP
jgi:hypothetical protein